MLVVATMVGAPPSALAANDKPPELVGGDEPWIGELGPPAEIRDHIVMMWDEIIDPTSIPAPTDFAVTKNLAPVGVTGVSLIFAGFADESFGLSNDGTSFMRLDLDTTWTAADSVLVSYTPGTNPVRDLGLGQASAFVDKAATTFDPLFFEMTSAAIDSYYGADHVLLGVTHPLVPTSIPGPDEFSVTADGQEVEVVAVTHLHPDLGLGLLDLQLAHSITDETVEVLVDYAANPTVLTSARTAEEITVVADLPVALVLSADTASTTVSAGGAVTTASLDGPTVADPIGTTVTTPTGGLVTIDESNATDPPPAGYTFFGQQVVISAPDAVSADAPLVLRFDIDASVVPAGEDETTIAILRNGVAVPDCQGAPGVADPSPCISERTALTDGDIAITVLTLQASTWNFAIPTPFAFSGFFQPVDGAVSNKARAGQAIPVKFSLSGDRGLGIFAAGSPASRQVSCDIAGEGDAIEQTVSPGSATLSYDSQTDTYTYVWKTQSAWEDTCRRLVVTFSDGSVETALFDFRR